MPPKIVQYIMRKGSHDSLAVIPLAYKPTQQCSQQKALQCLVAWLAPRTTRCVLQAGVLARSRIVSLLEQRRAPQRS